MENIEQGPENSREDTGKVKEEWNLSVGVGFSTRVVWKGFQKCPGNDDNDKKAKIKKMDPSAKMDTRSGTKTRSDENEVN